MKTRDPDGEERAGGTGGAAAPEGPRSDRRALLAAIGVCLLLALVGGGWVSMERSWGWDESMHAELPAARVLLAGQQGDWGLALHAVHDCQQYPFVYPLVLAAVQAVTGVSEHACRVAGRAFWALGCFGLFLLGRELTRSLRRARGGRPGRGDELVPWLALALGALSPMALAYSGSLFLEVPFATVSIYALHAWLRRGPGASRWRELAAGAWVALAFFTKFNYGVLLGLGLAVDFALELVLELRAGRGGACLRRAAWLIAVPLLSMAWWFLLPLPLGWEMARSHQEAFASFLGGNRDASMDTRYADRLLHLSSYLVYTPRVLLVLGLGLLVALVSIWRPGARALGLVLVASAAPVWLHNFHQDRFLIPQAVPLWVLAALGLARLLPVRARPRAVALTVLPVLCAVVPSADSGWVLDRLLGRNEEFRGYQLEVLASWRDLSPARSIETNGLERADSDALLALLEPAVRPGDRVGWLGVSTRFSPAALHAGLLERGAGAPSNLLRGELHETFITLGHVDPEWSPEQLLAWAAPLDLVFTTSPIDLAADPKRAFMERYQTLLIESGRWEPVSLGQLSIARPRRDPVPVEVFACRPRDQ